MAHSNLQVPELAGIECESGLTRGSFILRGALTAGAVFGVGAVGPFVSQAFAAGGDIDIVNFALTLEYLETAFYEKAMTLGLSGDAKKFAAQFASDEAAHVAALKGAVGKLGGTAAKKPTFAFPITDEKSFLKLAMTLEDTGVGAYNGAGPAIKSVEILAAAGSIVQIEARHAAIIRILAGVTPAPYAFDKPIKGSAVLAAVKPLIVA